MSSRRSRSGGIRISTTFEAVEEILPEPPGLDVRLQVPVGRGDDADVGVAGARLADPLEVLLLQEAQQLGLQRRRDLADLVEEQRPPLGHLDPPRLIADRAGERPLGVSEQLARQQLLRQRRAVGDHERARGARALAVDGARQDALAGAVLAGDEDGRVAGGDARRGLEHRVHRGRAAADLDVGRPRRRAGVSSSATLAVRWRCVLNFSTRCRICAGVNGFGR